MTGALCLRNRQRVRRIDLRLLRRIARHLLTRNFRLEQFELCVHLVESPEMVSLNEKFLQHAGSTDVITFNYNEVVRETFLHGEIFICPGEGVAQARRFGTSWQSELVRYLIHGLLHLRGYDDAKPTARHKMKREEDRLLREVSRHFAVLRLHQSAIQ